MSTILDLEDYPFEDDTVVKFYWPPIQEILNFLTDNAKKDTQVLEIGPGNIPFPLATKFIGFNEKVKDFIEIDLDTTKFPYTYKQFDFLYCRHVLEDIQNPDFACSEIFRTCKRGYIETPSPLIEITKGVEPNANFCGYIHHRYIVWSYKNTIYFLPKYPLIEYLTPNKKLISIANNYPIYWNNYFFWDTDPKVVIYKNGVNMEIREDYQNLILRAVTESILNTNEFALNLKLL